MANVNFHNVSKEELLLKQAFNDVISFGKLFLPEDFMRSETPPFHYELADKIDDKSIRQLAIIMSRGHGKTVFTKADIVRDLTFSAKAKEWGFTDKGGPYFYGWVSATQKLATGNMDYVKHHLEYNEKIKYYFGDIKGKKWTEQDIETSDGSKLISRSNISGIRGGAKLHKRYDLVVLDDFEDENNTITAEARDKNSTLVTAVVFPALEPADGRLRVNGTPVHFDSFVNNLIVGHEQALSKNEDFSWDVFFRKAIDKKGNILWPSWFPKEEIERKKKFYADSGQPQKFYQEYLMEVQSEDDAIFTREHIKYWEGDFRHDNESGVSYVVVNGTAKPVLTFSGVDPATDSVRRDSDFSVIITVAVDMDNNVYVLDYIRKRSLPVLGIPGSDKKGIVDYMYETNRIYHPRVFTVEDTTMSKPLFQAIRAESLRRNDFSLRWREEKPGTRMSKRDRIQEILSQRFAVGQIHIKKNHYSLQREIIQFGPRMAHDDAIDALAYSCKYAYPPKGLEENKEGFTKKKRKAKDWVIA